MNQKFHLLSVCCVLALIVGLAGCGKGDKNTSEQSQSSAASTTGKSATAGGKKAAKPKKKNPAVIDAMNPTSVVVRVNGTDVTKGEFATWESLRFKIWALHNGKSFKGNDEDSKKFRNGGRMSALGEIIKRLMLKQYADQIGVTVSEDSIKRQEKKHLRLIKKGKSTLAEANESFTAREANLFRTIIESAALCDEVLKATSTNDIFHVTEQQITNRINYVRSFNQTIDVLNATNQVRALEARKAILESTSTNAFVEVAMKYADTNVWEATEWETVTLDEFEGEDPLLQWLVKAEVGDLSQPLVLDDGLSIVGLKQKYPSDGPDGENAEIMEYELVRCYFNYYEKIPEIEDRAELVRDMIQSRRDAALQDLTNMLTERCVIEFPNGNNLFYPAIKAKKQSKSGQAKPEGKGKNKKAKKKVSPKSPALSRITNNGGGTERAAPVDRKKDTGTDRQTKTELKK